MKDDWITKVPYNKCRCKLILHTDEKGRWKHIRSEKRLNHPITFTPYTAIVPKPFMVNSMIASTRLTENAHASPLSPSSMFVHESHPFATASRPPGNPIMLAWSPVRPPESVPTAAAGCSPSAPDRGCPGRRPPSGRTWIVLGSPVPSSRRCKSGSWRRRQEPRGWWSAIPACTSCRWSRRLRGS